MPTATALQPDTLNNKLTSLSASNGDSLTLSYNAQGRIKTTTDQTGQTTTYTYDSTNQFLKSITNSDGTTSFSYGHPYDPAPNNNQTQYEYDIFGNRSATIYNGQRIEYLVDPLGMGDVLAVHNFFKFC